MSEIEAIQTIDRVLEPLDHATRMRIFEWLVARQLNRSGFQLPRYVFSSDDLPEDGERA